jgi:hypothetical protein
MESLEIFAIPAKQWIPPGILEALQIYGALKINEVQKNQRNRKKKLNPKNMESFKIYWIHQNGWNP